MSEPLTLKRLTVHHRVTDFTLFASTGESGMVLKRIAFGVHLSWQGVPAEESDSSHLTVLGERIGSFLSGTDRSLDDIWLPIEQYTDFQRAVLMVARSIKWGETISYKELARRAGFPGATRAAGSVMRKNDFPLIIPCHRVIRSDGTLGGFSGEEGELWVGLKKTLLEREQDEKLRS